MLNKRLDEYMLDYGKSNVKSDNFKSSNNSSTHGPKRLRQRYVNVDEIWK